MKAILVGAYKKKEDLLRCQESLEELLALAETYGFLEFHNELCHVRRIDAATYIGKGKVDEIAQKAKDLQIDAVIFDEEISPNQQKNLEGLIKKPVLDRTGLIIEVFAQRAKSREAKLQVDVAKIRYELPRLKRLWTHLSRQRTGSGGGASGGGYLKGEGEKQIEIDRRILDRKLVELEKEIIEVKKQRSIQRGKRRRHQVPTFAIVGYTNAGKSTLLNALTQAGVLAEDKLFATLDTTTRRFVLPNHQEVLLVDTVGFVKKLPHKLVEAFKSTLEEASYTDILLHVIDVSHKNAVEQANETFNVLKEIGADKKPMITLLNKIDREVDPKILEEIRYKYPKTILFSMATHQGFEELYQSMIEEIKSLRKHVWVRVPQSEYKIVSLLMKEGRVISTEYNMNYIFLEAQIPAHLELYIEPYLCRDDECIMP